MARVVLIALTMRNTEVQTIDQAELHRVQGGCKRGGGCQMAPQAQMGPPPMPMRPRRPPEVDVQVGTGAAGAQAMSGAQQVTTS